ncbi:hypothetical protein C8034_v011789 [Colletotrichum sidae]|uniref:Uncharacterized protein n=1 Tax=Colletotrichum sidae TaxID=1347389 RepID=A0A4V3I376_9PEZI|nr:hypothetical protein C8034_v011789 [Colletotrichum sidae]
MLVRAKLGEPTVPEPTCYRTEEESINFFTRYIADTRYILDQPSPSLVVVRVREKAAVRKTMMLLRWKRESDMIDDFLGGNSITDNRNKEPKTSKLSLAAVETWVIYVGEQHDAHDQLSMLGGMRRLWQHGWFTDPQQNAFAKVLNLDLEQFPVDFDCDEDAEKVTAEMARGNLVFHDDGMISTGENVDPDEAY